MISQNTDIFETDMLEKNNTFKEPVPEKNFKTKKTKFFLKPKFLILTISIIILFLISIAIFAASQKPKTEISYDPNIVISSPESQNKNKNIDPEIQKELNIFSNKVENLQEKQLDFSPPVVDYKSLSSF